MGAPWPTSEVVTITLGACSWVLAAGSGLALLSGRDDEGLDALGTGLAFLTLAAMAGLCAVLTLAALAVRLAAATGRLRPATWVLGVLPAVAGIALLPWALLSSGAPAPAGPAPTP